MSKSKSKAGDEFLTTIGDGISEAGSAVLGIFTGGDSMSSREYKLEKERIASESLKAEAEAAKEAALYAALSGNSANSGVSGIVNRGKPSAPMSGPGMSFRLKKIAKGVVAGGAAGFVTGSVVPVIGNMAGLVGGAILGGFAADSLE